jgi:L-ascorbate metabolism protein UlaG (beta-lactamase superfamily)
MWKISNEEVSVVTDPFTDIGYKMPENVAADILLSSHDHFDHNNFDLISGNPKIIITAGKHENKGVKIENFPTWHDENKGADRGNNLMMKFEIGGKTFLHCGDLGHDLSEEEISKLGKIDVLMIPVGGFYTIDAKTAKSISDRINPLIVFPMHFKTKAIDFPIAEKQAFTDLVDNVRFVNSTELVLNEEDFNIKQTIIMNYE